MDPDIIEYRDNYRVFKVGDHYYALWEEIIRHCGVPEKLMSPDNQTATQARMMQAQADMRVRRMTGE